MKTTTILLIAILTIFLISCTTTEEPPEFPDGDDENQNLTPDQNEEPVDQTPEEPIEQLEPFEIDSEENVVTANNRFAIDLYKELNGETGNVFFSPYSFESALGMTLEGAVGRTQDEMISVLHLPTDEQTRLNSFKELASKLNAGSSDYTLKTANAIWMEQDFEFEPAYVNTVEDYYNSEANLVSYKTNAIGATREINNWVEDKTNNKIKDLIPEGLLDSTTRMVLTNAIYFKGTWVLEFDSDDTYDEKFTLSDGTQVTVDMMKRTDDEAIFGYYEDDDVQVLEMMYKGEDLSMIVILPKDDLQGVEEGLTAEKIEEWKDNLVEKKVYTYLPKFKFETKYMMKDKLINIGMPTSFNRLTADFTSMSPLALTEQMHIDEVIHQTYVEVNEEGTEAAAATAVIERLGGSMAPSPTFKADHQFIFIIQERETGAILFMGLVRDPR